MKNLKLFFALFAMLALGVGNAWAEDYSATHTSNVTFTAGTNGSTAKVIINSVGYDAMKLGNGSKTGTMTFKIPVGTTKIHLHVAGWKSNNTKLNLSANNGVTLGTTSITSTADNGVNSSSPFTLATQANATTNYYKVVEITSGATVAETTITIQTTSTGYRAVVWGVNAEITGGGETPEPDPDPTPDPEPDPDPTPDPEEPGTSGETVTYILKDDPSHPANSVDWFSGTIDQYTGWTATKGTNNPKYYDAGEGLRVYNGGIFTITSTKVMTSITLTFAGTTHTFSADNTTNPQTVTPNAKSYEWSVAQTCRLQKIEITYAADAGGDEGGTEEPVLSVSPASHTFATTNVGETATQVFEITAKNTTETLSAEISNTTDYAISAIADNKITVTYQPQTAETHEATLTIKAGDEASATVTLSGKAVIALEEVAQLPFAFNSGKADIENTVGMTQEGLGSDYTTAGVTTKLKFDGTGDWVIIHFNGQAEKLAYEIKGNGFSGGKFTVQQSADGSAYTDVVTYTELGSAATKEHELADESRYVKFIYTEKVDGNVGLGNIKIALPEEEPGEGGGETPEEPLADWVLTPLADITTNDLVVITMTKGETTWAMTNDKGTSAAPAASVVTLSADALANEPEANLKWVIKKDGNNLTIYPYNTYETWLYCIDNNNGVRVGDNEDNKLFTIDADYGYMYNVDQGRYLGIYNSQDWRCYKTMHDNIKDQTLAFYVKKNANDNLPSEDPEEPGEDPVVPTITPVVTFVFNTAEGLADLGINYPTTEDNSSYKTILGDNAKYTQDGITMTTTDGSTPTRAWLNGDELDLRVYKNATMTFSVPDEHKITAVVFDGEYINHLLVNGVAVSDKTWIGNAQEVTFTAKSDARTIKINTISFALEYTRDVTSGNYGTICLPYAVNNYTGATFYKVAGKEDSKIVFDEVTLLEAGTPYIFMAEAAEIKLALVGEEYTGSAKLHNSLQGTFTQIDPAEDNILKGNYVLYNNIIKKCGAYCGLYANRAYFVADDLEYMDKAPAAAPGRRRISLDVTSENTTTGLDNITNSENTTIKVIENGQLIIIRNGEKYNIQGQKL